MLKGSHHKPSSIRKMREVHKIVANKPEVRERNSKAHLKFFAENPEAREAISKNKKEYYSHPTHREDLVVNARRDWDQHPERRELYSQRMVAMIAADPELPKRANKAMREKHMPKKSSLPDIIEI